MEEVKYDLTQEPIVMSKGLLDLLLQQTKPADLIALYTYYYYTAKWQHTNQPRATTGYVAKGLRWSEERVQSRKKTLLELGLIEDVQAKNEKGQITGHYVRVNFLWGKAKVETIKNHPTENPGGGTENDPKTTPPETLPLGNPGGNALSNNIRNALNNNIKNSFAEIIPSALPTNGKIPSHRTMRSRSTPIPERTIPLPQDDPPAAAVERTALDIGRDIMKGTAGVDGFWKLLKLVRQVDRMPSGSTYWFQQCTLVGQMVTEQGLEQNRIMELVSWLYVHHSDEFVPRFFDALEFRQKFFKLESAMLAAKRPNRGRHTEFRTPEGDRVLVGPNGSMAHCVTRPRSSNYEDDRYIEA